MSLGRSCTYAPRLAVRAVIGGLGAVLTTLGPAPGTAVAEASDVYIKTEADGSVTITDSPPTGAAFADYERVVLDLDEGRPQDWARIDRALLRDNLDHYDAAILRASARFGVPAELIKAVMLVESGMNPKARSPKGAQGLMQLMPGTAGDLGVDNAWDPEQNIMGGARYLAQQLDTFSDRRLALAAYNAGPGAVRRHGGVPPYAETQYYVTKVLKYYQWFLGQRRVGS